MPTIDLRQTIRGAILRSRGETSYFWEVIGKIDWDAAERLFNTMQAKRNGTVEDDPNPNLCPLLRKYKEFRLHADVRSAFLLLDMDCCNGKEEHDLYEYLEFILEELEGYQMKKPKWIPECDIDLVRTLAKYAKYNGQYAYYCETCMAPALDVDDPDFEEDLLKLASFTDFEAYKKRRMCACCAARGESVMEVHDPEILVCGTCAIPIARPDKKYHVFIDALMAKLYGFAERQS